jgi:hypothetical protein
MIALLLLLLSATAHADYIGKPYVSDVVIETCAIAKVTPQLDGARPVRPKRLRVRLPADFYDAFFDVHCKNAFMLIVEQNGVEIYSVRAIRGSGERTSVRSHPLLEGEAE